MLLNIASLNVRGLKESRKCTRLLAELKTLGVDVAAVQETHFTRGAECWVLESDFKVFSAYGSRTSAGVSLLVGRSLDADVDVVFADDGGRLVLVDVAVKSFKFRLVAVYAPNIAAKRVSFFRRLAPFLDDPKRLVLTGDWNAILDPKIDKVGRGANRLGRCESSHVGFITRHDLVDRFRLDYSGQEMSTWLDSLPSAEVDDYRPITLLNTELKIFARVLANRLQLVIIDLIGPEQTFAVKGRSIQDNLHLIREVLEGIKDGIEAALISLDQSKAFDRVDHRFLATVLETAGFTPEFHRWISMMYHNPQAVVQVNGRRSWAFAIDRSVQQGFTLSPLLYVLALEPLLHRLRDVGTSPALRGVPFAGRLAARVSAFADDITVFVSRRLDIEAVKEVVCEYERIAGAKVNFDKSEGLQLGAWTGSNTLPGLFPWSDGSIRIFGVWFGPDLQLERNWSEVHAKVNAQVGIWLSVRLSLKGRGEGCAVYVFPLILYRLVVLPLPKARRLALQRYLSRLLWGGARPMVHGQVCIQRTRYGGLGMPDLESHWLAERLAYLGQVLTGDAVWRRMASRTFPRLNSDPKA